MGTLDYMAPEQAMDTKTADARADIYSLGCTLHYLLTGRPPYGGDSLAAKIVAHRMNPIPSLRTARDDVPVSLDAVFDQMLAKQPSERQANMTAVLRDLANVAWDREASDAPDVTIAAYHRGEEIDFPAAEAEDLEEPPALDDLSDKSVGLTQRWVASSVSSVSVFTSWLSRHRTLAIGTVAVCVVGLALLLALVATFRTTTGDLVVEVNEPGAKVEVLDVDGKTIITGTSGASPLTWPLESGEYQLKVEKDGFIVHTEAIEIAVRGRTAVRAKLRSEVSEPGTFELTVSEADAVVQLLGETGNVVATYRSSGTLLCVPLSAGNYSVVIEKSEFQRAM